MDKSHLKGLSVADIKRLVMSTSSPTVLPDAPVEAVLAKFLETPRTRSLYVVDADGLFLGTVFLNSTIEYLFPFEAQLEHARDLRSLQASKLFAKTAKDLMDKQSRRARESTPVSELAISMLRDNIDEVPLVDAEGKLAGYVNLYDIIERFLKG